MKKLLIVASFILLGASFNVMADPSPVTLVFTCPTTNGTDEHTLTNWGSRVAGFGTETVNGKAAFNSPYFNYSLPSGANVPTQISAGNYSSDSTEYDSTLAIVTCHYTSSSGYSPLVTTYQITNGAGGVITAQTVNSITINAQIGLKT